MYPCPEVAPEQLGEVFEKQYGKEYSLFTESKVITTPALFCKVCVEYGSSIPPQSLYKVMVKTKVPFG